MMGRKKQQSSIQKRLILMIAAVLVVFTLVMTLVSTQFIRYSTTQALEQSMQQTAQIAADRIDDYLNSKVSLVQSIASRVGSLYEPYLTQDYENSDIAFLEKQMSSMAAAYGFDFLFAIDANGYTRTSKHSDINSNAPDYYTAIALEGKSLYLSDIISDSGALGGNVLNISAPIIDEAGNRIGVLVAKLDALFLSELITDINVGSQGSSFIMNASGDCIAHKNPEMCFWGSEYVEYRNNPQYQSLNQLWDNMRDNTEGFTTYEFNGTRLAAYDTIDGSNNWTLAVTADENEFMRTADRSVIFEIMIAAGLLLLALIAFMLIIRPIVKRIVLVTNRIERLSQGDLQDDLVPDGETDEVGRLTAATSLLVQDLNRMIATVNQALSDMAEGQIKATLDGEFNGDFQELKNAVERNLAKLGDLVERISYTSEEVSRGAEQIAEGATSLAQGAAEQASSIEELYSTVTDLFGRAKNIADPSIHYLDESEFETNDEIEAQRLEKAPTLVDKLNAAMDSIRQRLAEVRKIASAIDGISSETGMLALNASVEATHAGEYGKGFAVIASDVRGLSEKCRQESNNADKQLDSIIHAMDRGEQVVSFTIEAVVEMSQALAQVETALSQISSVIEDTAATAEESAASSEELSAQAEMLKELVSGFNYER